jgi:sugar phosphate isomerase/epimerase
VAAISGNALQNEVAQATGRKHEVNMVKDRRISFVAFWYENLHTERAVARALAELSSLGYTGVDWKSTCFDPQQSMAMQLKRAVTLADGMGMRTCNAVILGSMVDDNRLAFVDRISAFIRACAEAGIPHVNTAPGGAPDTPESWDRLTDSLEKILRVCEECGVDLALESVVGNLVHDYPTTRKMFSLVDSKHLRLTLDPSHYHLYKSDIPAAVRALGTEKIAHVHMKDAIGSVKDGVFPDEWIFPILGEGNIEWTPFFEALDAIGYEGYLSIEFEAWRYMQQVLGGSVKDAARLSMASAQALISNYVASCGK